MRMSSLFSLSIAAVVAACGSSSSSLGPGPDAGVGSGSGSGGGGGGSGSGGPFAEAPHPALPILVQQGVGVLRAPKIVTVTFPGEPNAAKLETFGATATNNAWWDTVRQGFCDKGSSASCLGDGPPGTKVELTTAPAASYTDSSQGGPSSLQAFIKSLIPGQIPQPDAQTILVFYVPSTTTITLDGASSCTVFGGYHNSTTAGGTKFTYAIVNECPPLATSKLSAFDETTFEASHEIVEAATDPYQSQVGNQVSLGYYLDFNDPSITPWNFAGGEAGDLCLDVLGLGQDATTEGGFTVQRMWSNAAAAAGHDPCIPAVSATYFNVAPETWLETADVGGSTTMTADAFSTAAIPSWTVLGIDLNGTATNPSPYVGITVNGAKTAFVNNGDKVKVSVTLKQDPASLQNYAQNGGAIAVLVSLNNSNPRAATEGHFWPFLVTSKADALDSGLSAFDAAANLPIQPPPFKMTNEQRANLARVFSQLQLN